MSSSLRKGRSKTPPGGNQWRRLFYVRETHTHTHECTAALFFIFYLFSFKQKHCIYRIQFDMMIYPMIENILDEWLQVFSHKTHTHTDTHTAVHSSSTLQANVTERKQLGRFGTHTWLLTNGGMLGATQLKAWGRERRLAEKPCPTCLNCASGGDRRGGRDGWK
jgi:hypothetical protein